jgi:hypothetical protein
MTLENLKTILEVEVLHDMKHVMQDWCKSWPNQIAGDDR